MTIPRSWILGYIRQKDELRQREKVLQFFQMLAEHNCYVASTLEIGSAAIWKQFVTDIPIDGDAEGSKPFALALQPGVSEKVRQEAEVYATTCQKHFTVEVRLMARSALLRGFEFIVTLAPDDGVMLLSVNDELFFRPGQAGMLKFHYWTKMLQEMYLYWHFLFMHEFIHQGSAVPNPTWENVQMLTLPALYTLNLFGPEFTRKLGYTKLLQTPAWLVEALDDQGILLIPTDMYGLTSEKTHSFAEVADYVGALLGWKQREV